MAENGDAMVALLACTPSRTGATRQGWVPLVLRVQPMIKSAQASVTKTNGFRLNLPLSSKKHQRVKPGSGRPPIRWKCRWKMV